MNSVAKAALAGASGVALAAEELSDETLVELIHACHALDMEPFVEVIIMADSCSFLLFLPAVRSCSEVRLRLSSAGHGQEARDHRGQRRVPHHVHPLHLQRS